jgi:hypothetical protein
MFAPLLLSLVVPAAAKPDPPSWSELAPHASGIALAEVVEVTEYDARPMDGNKGVRFRLKLVRGTGVFRETVTVVTAFGGKRPPGRVPKPSLPVRSDSLKKDGRYWVVFASEPMWVSGEFNQGVIAVWPEKDANVADVLDAVVKKDVLHWSPQHDPKTGLTYGHVAGEKSWRARVEKGGKLLWERVIPGKKIDGYFAWGLWDNTGNDFPSKMPPCGRLLITQTATDLERDNEFGVPAGTYYIRTGFDGETGKRYVAWVLRPQASEVRLVEREYEPDSGTPRREDRFDFLKAGGKKVGAKTEDWYRKLSRIFDPKTGKVTREDVYRYDPDAEADRRWVNVKE